MVMKSGKYTRAVATGGENVRRICLEFADDDPLLDVIKKYGLTSDDIEQAISAWAYTFANTDYRDEIFAALNHAFKLFRWRMTNVNPQKFRKIYNIQSA